MHAKLAFNQWDVSGVHHDMDTNPKPPMAKLTRWVQRRFNPFLDVHTDSRSAKAMLLNPYMPMALDTALAA